MVNTKTNWALIIGGSQGLGLATAQQLAEDGFNLLIVHRDFRSDLPQIETEFESIRQHVVQVLSFNKDAVKTETITQVFDIIKSKNLNIKVLVHSLAKGNLKSMTGDDALNTQDFLQTIHAMGINFYEWSKALVDSKCYSSTTKLIAFTSEGNQKVSQHYGAVSTAKATLESVMRQMAVEFAPLGFTANCIQAGMTETQSFQKIPNAKQLKSFNIKRNPFHRLTQPEDVAKVVSLLVDKKADWINGCVIPVDGGERLR